MKKLILILAGLLCVTLLLAQEPSQAERYIYNDTLKKWEQVIPYTPIDEKYVDANLTFEFGNLQPSITEVHDLRYWVFNFYKPNEQFIKKTTIKRITRIRNLESLKFIKGVHANSPAEFKFKIEVRKWWWWRYKRVTMYKE